MTGIFQISWSKDDSRLVFAGYEKGGWDIFTMNNPLALKEQANTPSFSNYLKRKNIQLDLTYTDSMPVPENQNINPFETHVFAYGDQFSEAQGTTEAPEAVVLNTRDSTGAYEVNKYKTRFTVDLVDAQAGYSNFFGVQGNALMVFSDIMGNHQIQFGFELYRNLDNSDLMLGYDYLPNRANLHARIYNLPDDYLSYTPDYFLALWHFRKYGAIFGLDYPFSKYTRFETSVNWLNIYQSISYLDRTFENRDRVGFSVNKSYVLPEVKLSFDNVLYGSLYPISGWRMETGFRFSPDMPNSSRQFATFRTDIRKYIKVGREYSFALRASAASSYGKTPETFMAGGISNWINYQLDNAYIDILSDYEDLYFSEYVVPVRGAPYFAYTGNHYTAFNAEFRFPFIEYLSVKWPISMVVGNVRGELFSDWVKTWDAQQIAGKSLPEALFQDQNNIYWGTGFGMRMNLGIFVLRYDMAFDMSEDTLWNNRQHIWSLGLDF
jgi:hypothetical protein